MSLGNYKVCYADAAVANVIAGFWTRSSSSYVHTIKRQEVLNRDPLKLKASVKGLAYTWHDRYARLGYDVRVAVTLTVQEQHNQIHKWNIREEYRHTNRILSMGKHIR